MTKPTKSHAQRRLISLGIHTFAQCDQSSPCAQWVAKDARFLHVDNEASDQTGMPRLISVFVGHTGYFVGFVMLLLKLLFHYEM